MAVHVRRGVGLGEAAPLRVRQCRGQRRPLALHPREDDVGGAVDDHLEAAHAIATKAVAQQRDHRQSRSDGGFVAQRRRARAGQRGELETVRRQRRLVGGDHRFAGAQGALDQAAGAVDPAHHLDDHLDRGVVDERVCVTVDAHARQGDVARSARVTHRHATQHRRRPGAAPSSSHSSTSRFATAEPTVPSPIIPIPTCASIAAEVYGRSPRSPGTRAELRAKRARRARRAEEWGVSGRIHFDLRRGEDLPRPCEEEWGVVHRIHSDAPRGEDLSRPC